MYCHRSWCERYAIGGYQTKGGSSALGLGEGLTKAQTWTHPLEQHDLVESKDKWQAFVRQ
jgi:hypothetical protein